MKEHKCDLYKAPKECNSTNYSKNYKCDAYIHQETLCQYVSKIYYAIYLIKKEKCADYEDVSPRYTTNSKLLIAIIFL